MEEEYGERLDAIRALVEPYKNRWGQSEVGDLARAVLAVLNRQ